MAPGEHFISPLLVVVGDPSLLSERPFTPV